ncbi:MAG: glycosyltransferase [Pseudomonadota bacterium]|nr:glycosyltransferase [Pseudomonadota bacterium]
MRIAIDLQACQNGSHGRGIGRYALSMARALVRNGRDRHSFRILLSDRFPERIASVRDAFSDLLDPSDIVVCSIPERVESAEMDFAWRTRAAEVVWADFVASFKPDAYFTPSLFEGFWDNAVTSIEPERYLRGATVHDLIPLADPDFYLVGEGSKRAYARKINALRRCDFLFSVSEFSKREVVDRLGIAAEKIFVMPLGVEDEFCPGEVSDERRQALLRKFRLKGQFIINTSPFEARKNIPGLIAGFANVSRDLRKNTQLVIAGKMSEHDRNEIEAIASAEGLARNDVVLPGFVSDEDLIDLYRLCEVMVFPPLSEGFGLPPLEAMACGAAVLASSATSVPEVVGRRDVLFDPTDPGDIGQAITKVLANPSYRDELRAFGLQQASTFSWDRSATAILNVFEKATLRTQTEAPISPSRAPIKLAVVAMGGIPHSRESILVKDYIRQLSSAYDVTLFQIDGDLGRDVAIPLERRPLDDFIVHGGSFDRALYILDSGRVDVALPVMSARPGSLILYEALAPTTRNLSNSQIADLQATGGMRAVAEAQANGGWTKGAAAAALAHGLAVEADSELARAGGVVTVTPRIIRLSTNTCLDFRRARDIPVDVDLWLAFASDDDAAARILQNFRQNRQAAKRRIWLVLVPALSGAKECALPGRVYRMPGGFAGPYLEALSAAAAILIDDALPAKVRDRLRDDARVLGLPNLSLNCVLQDDTQAARKSNVPWSPAEDQAFLASIKDMLDQGPQPLAASPVVLARLPTLAGDRRPEPQDLKDVGSALAINAERDRSGRILVDVTAALRETTTGMTGVTRRFLRALLASPQDVQFVATDGETYYVAGAFMSALMGVSAFHDEALTTRTDDVLVALDLLDGDAAPPATIATGVRHIQAQVADIVFERPDLSAMIADALLEAAANEAPRTGRKIESPLISRRVVRGVIRLGLETSTLRDAKGRSGPKAATALAGAIAAPTALADSRLDTSFTVQGHVWGSYSLAIVNRRIAEVLNQAYPGRVDFSPVETTAVTDLSKVPEDDRPLIAALTAPARHAKVHATISQHYPIQPPLDRADIGMALVAWEESHLPPAMIETLNGAFDGALAQVRTVQKALVDSGVWIPSVLTGLPAEISDYEGVCKRRGPAKIFLHVSSCFPRKGVDVLLEAWGKAFTTRDKVKLVIKTFPNPHNTVQDQVWDLSRRYPNMAPIQILNRDMDRDELVDLFRDADVMVLPTRGEGYNLPALEAMAAGLPLIVTGHGGHRDFCGPGEARLLDYEFVLSGSHVRETVSYWANPLVDDLVEALREQTQTDQQSIIEARRQRAVASAKRAVDPKRWSRTVAGFAQSLVGPVERSPVRTSWVSTWAVRCGIAEYSRFLLEQTSPEWRDVIEVVADDRTEISRDLVDHRVAWNVSWDFSPERLLEDIDRSNSEAVVIQHQDGLMFWGRLAELANDQRLLSRVSIVTLHTVRSLDALPEAERLHVIEALGRFDRILVHTVGDLNDLKRLGLIENVALFPHGALRPSGPIPPVRTLNDGSAPVIGCHGFFFDHKRIDNLIRAAATLKHRWPNLRLRLVNAQFPSPISGSAIAAAKSVADETGMSGSIDGHTDFLPVDEIQNLLASCDLLVLPYDETGDSVSGAVRVAMSSQVPTLTTPVKIFSDLGDAVASVPTNEPEILADAIEGLLDSPDRRTELQERMQGWLEMHDWKRMTANLEGMVKALAYTRRRETRQRLRDEAKRFAH